MSTDTARPQYRHNMETPLDPLLPAFHILWNSAVSEYRKNSAQQAMNGDETTGLSTKSTTASTPTKTTTASTPTKTTTASTTATSTSPNVQAGRYLTKAQFIGANKPKSPKETPSSPVHFRSNFEAKNSEWVQDSDETVVVCTMACDKGEKFVRKIVHEGTGRKEWSRAEDLFVNWLENELVSQHSEELAITIYLCGIPMSTTSDGVALWMKNIKDEGKHITVTMKIASLGSVASKLKRRESRCGSPLERSEQNDAVDSVKSLKKLVAMGVRIEPISATDWTSLLELLKDRTSLFDLDLSNTTTAETLRSLLSSSSTQL